MNIDFIKWMVGYGDGFEIESFPTREEPYFKYTNILWSLGTAEKSYLYPLLLQRAIEGLNQSLWPWIIEQGECGSYVSGHEEIDTSGDTYDISKEKALKYIYEQERKS